MSRVTSVQRLSLKNCISETKSEKFFQLSSVTDFQCVTRHERPETKSEISPQLSSVTDFQSVTRHERSEASSLKARDA